MRKEISRLGTNLLVSALVVGLVLLSYSVFADTYATERTIPPSPIESVAPTNEPRLDIISGLANDEELKFGPWPIVSPLVNLQLANPGGKKFVLSFNLVFDMAMCLSPRVVSVTVGNRTKFYSLNEDLKTVEQLIKLEIDSAKFYHVTVEVSGPVCQVDSDPRLFYGRLTVNDFIFSSSNEFNFK